MGGWGGVGGDSGAADNRARLAKHPDTWNQSRSDSCQVARPPTQTQNTHTDTHTCRRPNNGTEERAGVRERFFFFLPLSLSALFLFLALLLLGSAPTFFFFVQTAHGGLSPLHVRSNLGRSVGIPVTERGWGGGMMKERHLVV